MCPIFLLLLLPLLSLAIPLLPRQSNSTDPFILRAFRQGSPIHLSSINANNGHFWLGKPTSSSCPSDPTPNCPTGTGTETAFVVSDNGHASLYTALPPGQEIYVAKNGALSFTPAPSPSSSPSSSSSSIGYASGFSYAHRSFTFSGTASKGWRACAVAGTEGGGKQWQVFADVRRADVGGCVVFEAWGEGWEGVGVGGYF